jgi:uncharacterized protein (TIRG00374 family)
MSSTDLVLGGLMNGRASVIDRAAPDSTHRRSIGVAVLCVSAVVFVLANRREVPKMWRVLTMARPSWCLTAGVLAACWMANNTGLQRATLRATGVTMSIGRVALGAGVAHFLNLTTKSAGAAGVVGLRAEARRSGLPENSVTAGYVLGALLTEWAFAAVLLASFVVLATDGQLSAADVAAALLFVLYAGSRVVVLTAAIRDRKRLRILMRLPSRLRAIVRRRAPHEESSRSDAAADELFESLQRVRGRARVLLPAVGHALATEVIAAGILWSCIQAVGAPLGPLQSLVAYSVSGLFGIVGFVPGGIGFVEVSLSAVLIGYGTSGATAAAIVVLYRLFEWWLPVALGGALTHRLRVVR